LDQLELTLVRPGDPDVAVLLLTDDDGAALQVRIHVPGRGHGQG
jgi:hypothetical protein